MKRALILLEFICLFGPAIAVLCFGTLFVGVMLLADGSENGSEWLVGAAVVVCGSWGVVSVVNLVFHLIADRRWPGKPVQLLGLGLGGVACCVGVLMVQASPLGLVFVAPIAATIHFVVLARRRAAS